MDEDQFFYGESNGRRGFLPSNFVEEVSSEVAAQLQAGGATDRVGDANGNGDEADDYTEEFEDEEETEGEIYDNLEVGQLVIGLYDYEPSSLSPNDDLVCAHASCRTYLLVLIRDV